MDDLKVIIAPMAGVTDLAYRKILREHGARLCYSEMVNVMAISYGNEKTFEFLATGKEDKPFGIQLFGNDPDYFEKAVRILEEKVDYDYLDINMGCPMRKIVNNGSGSALLRDEDKASRIVDRVVKTSNKPVSVKIRLGIDDDSINALSMSRKLSTLGINHISVHARTMKDMYHGKARWEYIREIKENLNIPVIGNGDIFTLEDAKKAFEEYKVDGIMLARGVQGNPFLVRSITNYLNGKKPNIVVGRELLISTINKHLDYMIQSKGERLSFTQFRKHLLWYLKVYGVPSKIRNQFSQIKCKEELTYLIEKLI